MVLKRVAIYVSALGAVKVDLFKASFQGRVSCKRFSLPFCLAAATACTWVKPVEQAESVALVPQKYADECRLLGQTESNVKDSVGILKRREAKVEEELATLAKNAAATMGGDTIVAKGEPIDGKQAFSIYRCDR